MKQQAHIVPTSWLAAADKGNTRCNNAHNTPLQHAACNPVSVCHDEREMLLAECWHMHIYGLVPPKQHYSGVWCIQRAHTCSHWTSTVGRASCACMRSLAFRRGMGDFAQCLLHAGAVTLSHIYLLTQCLQHCQATTPVPCTPCFSA
jgi:hypothetical protein